MGMTLRQSWFINGTLFNSEVWSAFSENDIKVLNVLDRKILRLILGAHGKAPHKMLDLETEALKISHFIAVRRLLYLHNILKRHDDEIILKIYKAQLKSPSKGDWVTMLADDMNKYDIKITDETVKSLSKTVFKTIVKKTVKEYAFSECMQLLDSHDKVRHIEYTDMNQAQDYITSRQFSNKQISLLFNLRCQSVRNIKNNFHTFYNNKIDCPFKCFEQIDSQEHILK